MWLVLQRICPQWRRRARRPDPAGSPGTLTAQTQIVTDWTSKPESYPTSAGFQMIRSTFSNVKVCWRYGPSGSRRAGARSVGCSPVKPMLLISSSHEKQTAVKPRASRDREFLSYEQQWRIECIGVASPTPANPHHHDDMASSHLSRTRNENFPRLTVASEPGDSWCRSGPAAQSHTRHRVSSMLYDSEIWVVPLRDTISAKAKTAARGPSRRLLQHPKSRLKPKMPKVGRLARPWLRTDSDWFKSLRHDVEAVCIIAF